MGWPYNTERWRALREEQLARQPVCQGCGDYRNLEVHHRDRISERQRREFDADAAFPPVVRLETLCESCHSLKTSNVPDREQTIRREWAEFLIGE